jgi:hypothetical protein
MNIPFSPYDFFGYLAAGFLILIGMEFTLGFPPVLGRNLTIVESAALLMAMYVIGQLVATPAKAVLEDILLGRILGRPNVNLFLDRKPRILGLIFPGFFTPLPMQTRQKCLAKAESEGVKGTGEDLFLHVRYSPAVLQDAKLMDRLSSFLNLYGFNRNLCFTAIVVGMAIVVAAAWTPSRQAEFIRYGTTLIATGMLLLYRYLKFLRQYSYELFNTYTRAEPRHK